MAGRARHSVRRTVLLWVLLMAGLLLWARCDTVTPGEGPLLVVEGFVDAERSLPTLTLRQAQPLDVAYPLDATTAVMDAEVALQVDGQPVAYRPMDDPPGRYAPDAAPTVPSGSRLALDVQWRGQRVTAESVVPPAIQIDSVRVRASDEPVEGIILDSLFIDPAQLDTLQIDSLRTGASEGFVYLVEARVTWTAPAAASDSLYWVRAQLRPYLPVSLDDFFFKPEQIFPEQEAAKQAGARREWTGVYAVPVAAEAAPLPPHTLRVALIRSGQDYARYASSRDDPQRRDPVSNVSGGVGILAGISVDSLRIQVE